MKENEPATPRDEDKSSDEATIRELPQPDVTENSMEHVRGGADLPTDKRRQIAHDM
jgi:hypothetical protein